MTGLPADRGDSRLEHPRLEAIDQVQARLDRQNRRFRVLCELLTTADPSQPLPRVLQTIARCWHEALGLDRALCYVVEPETGQAVVGLWPAEGAAPAAAPADSRLPSEGLAQRLATLLGAAPACVLPLEADGSPIGGVWLAGLVPLDADDMADLARLAAVCALLVRRTRSSGVPPSLAPSVSGATAAAADETQVRTRALEALAELAAGAAHEMNNPLAVISGRAQLLLAREDDPETQRMLLTIAQQADRLSRIVTELMNFARPPAPCMAETHAARFVQAALDEVSEAAQARQIDLVAQLDESLPPLVADSAHLQAAVTELLKNAIEAVDMRGRVSVTTRVAQDCSGVEVVIEDNGPGIPPDRVGRIFDPFYSGREAGRGLGLGLPKCWRIAQQHRGELILQDTRPGHTVFVLRVPWTKDRHPETSS